MTRRDCEKDFERSKGCSLARPRRTSADRMAVLARSLVASPADRAREAIRTEALPISTTTVLDPDRESPGEISLGDVSSGVRRDGEDAARALECSRGAHRRRGARFRSKRADRA